MGVIDVSGRRQFNLQLKPQIGSFCSSRGGEPFTSALRVGPAPTPLRSGVMGWKIRRNLLCFCNYGQIKRGPGRERASGERGRDAFFSRGEYFERKKESVKEKMRDVTHRFGFLPGDQRERLLQPLQLPALLGYLTLRSRHTGERETLDKRC